VTEVILTSLTLIGLTMVAVAGLTECLQQRGRHAAQLGHRGDEAAPR
jgi:hypothetical protein